MAFHALPHDGQGEIRGGGIAGQPFDMMQGGPGDFDNVSIAERHGKATRAGVCRTRAPLRFGLAQGGAGALETVGLSRFGSHHDLSLFL